MISPQTAAASATIKLTKKDLPVTFYVIGALDTDEEIAVKYHDGSDWRQANVDGYDLKLSSTGQLLDWWVPLTLKIEKPLTDAAVGVGVA